MADTLISPGASLDHQYCPDCGYDLSGTMLVETITCPECGKVCATDALLFRPPPGLLRRLVRTALGTTLIACVPLVVLAIMSLSGT